MSPFAELFHRFRKDERGVFLVIFAVLGLVLIATSGAVVDFSRVQQARTRAQTALDAAALALQSQVDDGASADSLKTQAQALLTERMNDSSITAEVDSADPDKAAGRLTLAAHIVVPTYFAQLVGIQTIRAALLSEVTQKSSNLEISLSLDITGSMSGSKITSLKNASKLLINAVIKDTQTPTYSRMAIVPWAAGVNVGSTYASNVRGTPIASRNISAVTYRSVTSKTVSGITRTDPGVITVNNVTGISDGTWVYITGVVGMTQINGKWGQVSSLDTPSKTFRLKVNGTDLCTTSGCGYDKWTSGGTVWLCATTNCEEVVTTSTNHGLETNDYTYIKGVNGMTSFNNGTNQAWQVRKLSNTTFAAVGSTPNNGIRTSGGTSQCANYGCEKFFFQNAAGGWNLWNVNTCVSERTTNPYNDEPPSTTLLAMNYLPTSPEFTAQCHSQSIQPLTDKKKTLTDLIDTLAIAGSTAGQIGLAWGWYMISPNFSYLWPTGANQYRPDSYGKDRLVKAIIFMTDGEFNLPYTNGVASKDSILTTDLMPLAARINLDSVNGTSKSQAETICDEIKDVDEDADGKPDILLYTVGFDLAANPTALSMLSECATSIDYFFKANNGAALEDAFEKIGRSLSELRVSK